MNRKNFVVGIICGTLIFASSITWGINHFFFNPETLEVFVGSSFEWHMMMEIDEDCCGYGFNISAVVDGDTIFYPDSLAFDWTGTAAYEAGFSTLLGPVYNPTNDYFGGTAIEPYCPSPKKIDAGTHIAIKVFGTISETADTGIYKCAGPHPGFICQMNLLSGDVLVDCDTGRIKVMTLEQFIRGDIDGSMRLSISDGLRCLRCFFVPGWSDSCKCDDATDADDNGVLSINDCIRILKNQFVPGWQDSIPPPHSCGQDPTIDTLHCMEHPCMAETNTANEKAKPVK